MEHAQKVTMTVPKLPKRFASLNPYFNGTFSKSLGFVYTRNSFLGRVLILILMEHAQRAFIKSLVIVVVSVLS